MLASVPFLNYFFKGIKYLRYNLNLIPPSPILNPVYIISKYGFKLCLTFISLNCMNKNEKRSFPLYFLFIFINSFFSSVQFSHSVVSDSLQPHESQHARTPCPSPTPGVDLNSRPLSRWCHPAISSSVVPFASCPQSLPASGSFPMSQLFTSGGQSTEFQLQHQSFQWTPRTDLL